MHPNEGIIGGFFTGGIGKESVNVFKVFPVGRAVIKLARKTMQNRPKGFLGGDVIKVSNFAGRERNAPHHTVIAPAVNSDSAFKIKALLIGY